MTSPRQKGLQFEKRVRTKLESEGWHVVKFFNNVELTVPIDITQADPAKGIIGVAMEDAPRMVGARGGRWRLNSTGFPDFLCFRLLTGKEILENLKKSYKENE